jgi:hypothetical protein
MTKNVLDVHNEDAICKIAAEFVQFAKDAVREAPHGSATLVLEWRAFQASRYITKKELSNILPVESAG